MELQVKRRKFLYYRNLGLSSVAVVVIAISTIRDLETDTFGGWLSILFVILGFINVLVVIKAIKEIAKTSDALIINDEGIVDNISPANMGLIKWEEISDCELVRFNSVLNLAIFLHDKQKALVYAAPLNEGLIKKAINKIGTGVFINTDVIDYNRIMLKDAILARLGKVRLDEHLISQP